NTRAFEYESIRNQQESKEFWGQIAALVVIVGVSLVCPPAGIALGVAYGSFELSSAVSGKDWISGRELGTEERVFRGLLSPLDIIPGVSSVTKFSGAVKLAHVGDMGQFTIKTGIKSSINDGVTHIRNMVETAGKMSTTRLKSAASAIKDVPNKLKNKLIDDTIEVGRFIDSAITHGKNIISTRQRMDFAMDEFGNMGNAQKPVENTHAVENKVSAMLSKAKGVNVGKGKVKGSSGVNEVKTFVDKGQQFTNGRKNKLKPNIKYKTGEYDYYYETDNVGRISKFETENLQLTKRKDRLSHSKNTPGKVKGQDHAGHLAGDRFGGSPKIDNLVSQLSDVNLKKYKKVEDKWAAALKEIPPKKVTVDVEIIYSGDNVRPDKFIVNYTIDGKPGSAKFKNL
ncbi:DNA/RNA non-specific endonuclease, partial [Heyndrickxia sporothermodurans]